MLVLLPKMRRVEILAAEAKAVAMVVVGEDAAVAPLLLMFTFSASVDLLVIVDAIWTSPLAKEAALLVVLEAEDGEANDVVASPSSTVLKEKDEEAAESVELRSVTEPNDVTGAVEDSFCSASLEEKKEEEEELAISPVPAFSFA